MSPKTLEDLLESKSFRDMIIVEAGKVLSERLGNYMKILGPTCFIILTLVGWISVEALHRLDRVSDSNNTLSKTIAVDTVVRKQLREELRQVKTDLASVQNRPFSKLP